MGATAHFKPLTVDEYESLRRTPGSVEDFLFPDDVDDPFAGQTDLDKSWHELHFLITGKLEPDGTPAADAILGGTEIGPNLGYGRARLIDADRVSEIRDALFVLQFDELFRTVDRNSPLLRKIYQGCSFEDRNREYLKHYFDRLITLYEEAAASGHALLAYLA